MGKDRAVKFAALWVGVVTAAHFAGDMYPGFVTPLLPFFKDKFQSDYLGNSLLPVMKYAAMAMQPLFGILSEPQTWPEEESSTNQSLSCWRSLAC